MKTAMQELIDNLESIDINVPNGVKLIFLGKEKEQICNAYTDGLEGPYIGAEQYYNQTYNTKQHIIDIMKEDEEDGLYNQKK